MPQTWKLVRYEPKSFAGINSENAGSSLVVLLDRENIIGFKGDQGTCKTSNLACLKVLLGGLMPENAVNSKDNSTKASMTIQLENGQMLEASVDKNNFRLYLTQEVNGKPSRSAVSSPKEFMRNLIGPLGVSPMFLKAMDGDKQIAWLREIANLTDEQMSLEKEILDSYKKAFSHRTDVNRDVKRLRSEMNLSTCFDYNKEHKVFEPNSLYERIMKDHEAGAGDGAAIEARWKEANDAMTKLTTYRTAKETLVEQRKKSVSVMDLKRDEIARLQKELVDMETELVALDKRIATGDEMIQSLNGAEERAAAAQAEMMGLSNFMAAKKALDDDSKKAKLYADKVEEADMLTAKLDKLAIQKAEFVRAIAPEVEGLDVCVASDMDTEFEAEAFRLLNPGATYAEIKAHVLELEVRNKTGIFYHGASVAELCESELWDLCLILWQHMGVNVVFIENLNALGTDAVVQINKFAEKGVVFYSEMERGQKDLQIVFQNKIPVSKAEAAV